MTTELKVSHLNKKYRTKKALDDVSFEVKSGQIVGLVGPNGSGKTTLMKAALGLIKVDGEVEIQGDPVTFSKHKQLEKVGQLIEYPAIYPFLTGYDHLKMFADGKNQKARIDELVQDLGMQDYIKNRAKSYSLGMKQKLGIAMALINNPSLVILDEPMNGLDPHAVIEVRQLIQKLAKQGVTFLISSHILSELEKVIDHLIIFNEGKVVRDTTPQELNGSYKIRVVIKTNDDRAACETLNNAGFKMPKTKVSFLLKDETTLAVVIKFLVEQGFDVLDVDKQASDLESSLMKLLYPNESAQGGEA
ncbi:ABC transporter ATP-binding protein [Holzapfeliella floricola]|uniref:ABC transporter, ATP-binding protein n=1 Tax=Holzapfeliella floricola DSM 23037 = JCM 16512 TaxID=1423744 RepID=A0A0R2DKW5_9LACO|nr:ABC transporter ATP-binding protein [Holzapfeliella floricola]KRN04729.1 ABC transporter, ATP-binding protein [Holzapfeliella floricola DSM 23037 = JCM 16512]